MLALLALSPLLGLPDSKIGCAKDANGVVGVACDDFCECGHQKCAAAGKKLHEDEDTMDRCYVHDPVREAESDCTTDVRCCIPSDQCDPTCTLDQQNAITWLLKEIANVTNEQCAVHFLAQVRGMTQDDDALCECVHSSMNEIERNGSPKVYTAAVDAINEARCRMTVGDDNTFHDITTRCMRTSVIGQPKLFTSDEGIKFFLPPGEMVDLVTWDSPSGEPIALRGSVFQQEGSLMGSRWGNVQWFRRFELAIGNDTALSVTSFHRNTTKAPEEVAAKEANNKSPNLAFESHESSAPLPRVNLSKYDATGQAHAKHAPEGSERERILQEKRVLWKLTKERDAALAQVEIERQRAEKAVAEAAMERKRSGKAERLSAATAAGAERFTENARRQTSKALSEAKEAKQQMAMALRERDAAISQAEKEHEEYEAARAEADAAELEAGLKRLEETPLKAATTSAKWSDVLQHTAVQAPEAEQAAEAELEMANIAARPQEAPVPVMHHAGRWKLATKGAGGYGWIAASQAKEASLEGALVRERAAAQVSDAAPEATGGAVQVTHRAGRWMAASAVQQEEAQPQGAQQPQGARHARSKRATEEEEEEAQKVYEGVHEGILVARAAKAAQQADGTAAVPEKVLDAAASKLDDLLVTKLQEILASKVSLKLDAMLDSKLDAILAGKPAPMTPAFTPATKASTSLLALQPASALEPASQMAAAKADAAERAAALKGLALTAKERVVLASKDASLAPAPQEPHKPRQTFVGVRLDGKHIFAQPAHARRATYSSDWAKEIGLKVTAVETREHQIGDDMSVRVDVETNKFNFRIWSSKADIFHNDSKLQIKYAHLNLNLLGPFPTRVGGLFAELRGKVPMSKRSKSFLRREDRQRTVGGRE